MLGAIIGDIIGSRFEFSAPPKKGFELFTPECDYTDDTICTVAVADAILHQKDYKQTMLEWCRRYPDPMGGYGTRFYHWLNSDDPQPVNSFGNGSAMRVSSVGWLFNDYNDVLKEAKRTAEFTHNHPEGIKGAQATAAAIFLARQGKAKHEIRKYVTKTFDYDLSRTLEEIRPTFFFDETCQRTVPEAITCFLEGKGYEDVVRLAVSLAGDADTLAAIAGPIASATQDVSTEVSQKVFSLLSDEFCTTLLRFNELVAKREQ